MNALLLDAAIKEAYASAPVDSALLHTLEIYHPSFRDEDIIRIAAYPVTGSQPVKIPCLLEDDSPRNPGQVKTFIGFPFSFTMPDNSSEEIGFFEISMGVDDTVDTFFELAAASAGIVSLHYRQYIQGRELDGPYATWPGIELVEPRRENGMLMASGRPVPFLDYGFGRIYNLLNFPALN